MAGKIALALALLMASASAFAPAAFHSAVPRTQRVARGKVVTMGGKENELRTRIASVTSTRKITEAMRLVAAAKVRRAQQAVLATRPFSETLQSVFGGLLERLGTEDVDLPLLEAREVGKVTLVLMSGDRGLCGGYNSYGIKKTEQRMKELKEQGVEVELVTIGKKPFGYFNKRPTPVVKDYVMGQAPTAEEANAISEYLLSSYLSGETDSVEIIYTQFVSLISSKPSIRTLLPLQPRGIESEGDEMFQLTTKDGDFAVEKDGREAMAPAEFPSDMIFEQDPLQVRHLLLIPQPHTQICTARFVCVFVNIVLW